MSGVGKTSFITRFAVNEFQEQHLVIIFFFINKIEHNWCGFSNQRSQY